MSLQKSSEKSTFETYSSFFGNLVILVGVIVFMILHFYYFHTMKKIKCKCVDNDYQGKIKFFIILQLILFSLIVVISMILAKYSPNNALLILTNKILFLSAIVCMFLTTYFIRLFLTSIDEGKCKCSKSGLKTFIDIVNKIKIILFTIYIIIALSLPILLEDFMNENLQKFKEEFLKRKNELLHKKQNGPAVTSTPVTSPAGTLAALGTAAPVTSTAPVTAAPAGTSAALGTAAAPVTSTPTGTSAAPVTSTPAPGLFGVAQGQ